MIPMLPEALATVTVPRFFTPTALSLANDCHLRLVLQSAPRGLASLPAGPPAALGTLTHRFLALCAASPESAATIFNRAYNDVKAALAADSATAHYTDLSKVLGAPAWSRFRFALIDQRGESPRAGHARLLESGTRASTSRFGNERTLTSVDLRLKGRADRISRLPDGTIEVRDHKTGEIFDTSGALDASVQDQLRCYGLMLLESDSTSTIRLVVDDGDDHEIPFTTTDRRKLKRRLTELGQELPAGSQMIAANLASPGKACLSCPFRHRCRAYLDTEPRMWAASKHPAIPRDTWGKVIGHSVDANSTFGIVLRDAAGRSIRVDRLDTARWSMPPDIGTYLWAFNLESPISRSRARAANLHPAVFHECPADSTQNRAWSLQLYSK
jgi:RecB family exonuclease